MKSNLRVVLALAIVLIAAQFLSAQSLMERLGRGVVAVRRGASEVYVGWRMLGTDAPAVGFNLYRSTGGAEPVRLNGDPLAATTDFLDTGADPAQPNSYFVRPVTGGVEGAASAAFTLAADAPVQPYLNVPLQVPPGGVTPDNASYAYTANDASVGDLDGDGEYEIVLKWDPTNSKDNSQDGYTGNVFIDAYKLDGTLLWRIDLGRNIRAGAHYTQFMVYDLDGDGKAEIATRTAPGTVDGQGQFVLLAGDDPQADYRNSAGYILSGPEYLTVFNGQSGAAMASVSYNPPRGTVSDWGDGYGNRIDRFLAGVAYLDGRRPSLVMARGYYTRAFVAAWDWRDGQLVNRWNFDTGHTGTSNPYSNWRGQGAHSLTIGDVDEDGRDEITYGAAAIDDDGTGLYSTLLGHGDALHMSDMDPTRPGQEVWMVHEDPGSYGPNGGEFRDAKTGQLIFGVSGEGADVGRGVAGDIDPRYLGYEMWASRGGLRTTNGTLITTNRPSQMNFMVWWDGDPLREILDGTTISKWNWNTNSSSALLAPAGLSSNNGTKSTPALAADILGDWREEVIWRTADNTALRIYTTTIPAANRIYTLMHDRQYREAIAWQNTAYNQPPHPSFYIGVGMANPPQPNIVTSLAELPAAPPVATSINRFAPFAQNTGAALVTFRVTFNRAVTGVDASDFALATTGTVTGTVSGVTAVSALAYNVTVGSLNGSGTVRLDLKASGTGITGGGVPIAGGFTGGEVYNRVGAISWINPNSGGLWSDAGNWDSGLIADGLDTVPIFGSFDVTTNNAVVLDSPRTLSGLTFGDANPASAASWTISDGGNFDNTLTLDVTSGVPAVTVNQLGAGALARIEAGLAGSKGLAKAGAGTLEIARPVALTGQVSVNAGTLRFAAGSSMESGVVNVAAGGGVLEVGGGSFVATGATTVNGNGGSLIVNGGTGAFAAVNTNNTTNGLIRVNGGTFTAASINIPRSSDGTPSFAFGFVVTGGAATVNGPVGVGTNNSWGSMSVEGGALAVAGPVTIGNQTSSGRGGQMRVTGGSFVAANAADGVILGRRASNVSSALFAGGISVVERFKLGFDSAVNAGSANLTVNGGTLFVGAGGITRGGSGSFASTVTLQSGALGAKADWSTTHPIALAGGVNLSAADALGAPFNITLGGVLSGAGGFTKTGGGTLTLTAANTYTGATTVSAGTLRVDSGLAAGGAAVTVNGGRLAGTGALNRAVVLNAGGAVAPGGAAPVGALSAASLMWNGGGRLAFDLDADSDQIVLSGALVKGAGGPFEFVFAPGAGFADGRTYTLATFGSTNFTAADFTYSGLPAGVRGFFRVSANRLQFTVDGSAPAISCPPDITTAAAAGAASAVVSFAVTATDAGSEPTITSVPASGSNFPVGTTVVNSTAADAAGNTSACSFSVTVRSTTTVALAPAAAQYSDAVTLQAAVSAPEFPGQPLAGVVQFTIDGVAVGAAPVTNGAAALPLTVTLPAGSYAVGALFVSDSPNYVGAGASSTLVVTRENAAAVYAGDMALLTAGPSINTAAVRLAARLTPEADGEGFGGDISNAAVTFELFKSNNTSATPDLVVGGVPVDANGEAAASVPNLAAETYSVVVKIDAGNRYWIANPTGLGILNIIVPSNEQRSGGGGWIADAASANGRANFGFNVSPGNKDGRVRGNWTTVFRGLDGFDYVVKANSWQDGLLQFAAEPGITPFVYTRSEIRGRCNVQKIDPATGLTVASLGNFTFEAHTFDGDQLNARQTDGFAFIVRDQTGQIWHQIGDRAALVPLGGGNVVNKGR